MSNISGGGGSFSSGNTGYTEEQVHEQQQQQQQLFNHFINGSNLIPSSSTTANSNDGSTSQQQQPQPVKKRRNQPGNPDPSAEVIALSPKTLMATNRFVCEICNKGFQRDQNLQLHRRGHNLPWKLKQRTSTEIRKRVYVCPESSCVHHNPARALGDLTGIKKHFCRKHGEKKWKCDKCSKKYAVQSDWKAHSKTCGTKEYKCDCGTIFSRRDSFITHRAFCDALAEENNKANQGLLANMGSNIQVQGQELMPTIPVNNNPNISAVTISEFSHPETKNALNSLPHKLMPRSMLSSSTSSTSLFSCPRNISSASTSCLQLSANSSSPGFELGFSTSDIDHHEHKDSHHQLGGSSAHMSATALLQKAAQMGATASTNMNSPMMQKTSFVTSIAPISSSSYSSGLIPQSTDHQSQQQLGGVIGGFAGDESSAGMHSMGMYNGLFNQNHGLLKEIEEHDQDTNSSTICVPESRSSDPTVLSIFGGNYESDDAMTLDFLGIGRTRLGRSFHEQQQQQQQQQEGMKFEGINNQQRMQGLSPFQQQMISNGQPTLEKPMWNV
uniref:Putative C2H2 and C2HC zinc fingers superfamily protein isoform 1 n=1 Tax=Davidia involucrata TaxID=16924 RepID=A0A5B7BYC4_DAVIN